MLFLIPPPLHRAALRIAHRVRRGWWRWRKPLIIGCRVVAVNEHGHVLLIRQSYGKPFWILPAGGMGRREDPLAAAARELAEETACRLHGAVLAEVVVEPLLGARNQVHVVTGHALGPARPDRREVLEAAFFALDALPEPLAPILHEALPRWVAALALVPRPGPFPSHN